MSKNSTNLNDDFYVTHDHCVNTYEIGAIDEEGFAINLSLDEAKRLATFLVRELLAGDCEL
jgi:hypothetical protein